LYKDLEKVKAFCKRFKIVGVSMPVLFDEISKKYPMTRSSFETSMLRLNKKPALNLKTRCLKYFEKEGDYAYEKFCKEQVVVSKEFWILATGSPVIVPPEKFSPSRRAKMSTLTKAELLSISEENEQGAMEKMLPVNWKTMVFGERVDFVKKVQLEKFRVYVLDLDPKLKKYFSNLKPRAIERQKFYTTIFKFPSDNYSIECKNLIKHLVGHLNNFGRASLQCIECTNPNVFEIREVK
jgi:hypothetical protein